MKKEIAEVKKASRLEKYKMRMAVKRLESNMNKIITEEKKVGNKSIIKLKEELKALKKESKNNNQIVSSLDELESDWDKFMCA